MFNGSCFPVRIGNTCIYTHQEASLDAFEANVCLVYIIESVVAPQGSDYFVVFRICVYTYHFHNYIHTYKIWNQEKTLCVIEDFHSIRWLWKVKCVNYKNHNKKVDAYETLAKKYEVSAADI